MVPTPTDAPGEDFYEEVPLPGFESIGAPAIVPARKDRRPYSASLAPTASAVAGFWARVVKAPGDGCWLLVAAVSGVDGYTRLSWRSGGVSRTESGHRFALLLAGQLQDGVVAEHRCNEPLCVRVHPDHVIASNQTANLRYAVACGRAGHPRPLAAQANRHARSVAVRDAVRGGWDPDAYARASGNAAPLDAPRLF